MEKTKKISARDNVSEEKDGLEKGNSANTIPRSKWKCIATHKLGTNPTIVIDELGLALLLSTVHGQHMLGGDWNEHRGDMFIFADNPTVRSCVGLWKTLGSSTAELTTTEAYLFNMLDYETQDCFHEIDEIEREKQNG